MRAGHTPLPATFWLVDGPLIFDRLDDPDVTRVAGPNPPQTLADQVHQAYVNFVITGHPGWPDYPSTSSVMIFDDDPTIETGGFATARALTPDKPVRA